MTQEAPEPAIEKEATANMEKLRKNPHPGRGIVMGIDENGRYIQIYWLMGKEIDSKNRILMEEKGVVVTVQFKEKAIVIDPSLIIYTAMESIGGAHVVSNGNQTGTIVTYLGLDSNFEDALATHSYEFDEPHYTPRISGVVDLSARDPLKMSIIRRNAEYPDLPEHKTISYTNPEPGIGYCVHTYEKDGNPHPSFKGEPYPVLLKGSSSEIAREYWDLLNPDNRVAIVVKSIDRSSGETSFIIKNKLGG